MSRRFHPTEQFSLPGFDVPASRFTPEAIDPRGRTPSGYTLFLAIFPEPEDAQRMAHVAAGLRGQHRLQSSLHSPGRLHVTLHSIPGFSETMAQSMVDGALAAATFTVASGVCAPFPIVFDRVLSFADSDAFVLRCDAGSDAAVARLRQSLTVALRRVELHHKPSNQPHMTMLYDKDHHVAEHPIEPIVWTATRLALIVSHVGLGHHQWIGEWALKHRP